MPPAPLEGVGLADPSSIVVAVLSAAVCAWLVSKSMAIDFCRSSRYCCLVRVSVVVVVVDILSASTKASSEAARARASCLAWTM